MRRGIAVFASCLEAAVLTAGSVHTTCPRFHLPASKSEVERRVPVPAAVKLLACAVGVHALIVWAGNSVPHRVLPSSMCGGRTAGEVPMQRGRQM